MKRIFCLLCLFCISFVQAQVSTFKVDINNVAGTATIQGQNIDSEHLVSTEGSLNKSARFASTNNLVDRILGRIKNGAPGEVGWRAVELLDAAYRSAAGKTWGASTARGCAAPQVGRRLRELS